MVLILALVIYILLQWNAYRLRRILGATSDINIFFFFNHWFTMYHSQWYRNVFIITKYYYIFKIHFHFNLFKYFPLSFYFYVKIIFLHHVCYLNWSFRTKHVMSVLKWSVINLRYFVIVLCYYLFILFILVSLVLVRLIFCRCIFKKADPGITETCFFFFFSWDGPSWPKKLDTSATLKNVWLYI